MGTRQTKGSLAERAGAGAASGPRRDRPELWASWLLRAGDKAGRAGPGAGLPPYQRRVGMVQELLRMVRQGRRDEAGTLLQHLRQVSAPGAAGGASLSLSLSSRSRGPCAARRAAGASPGASPDARPPSFAPSLPPSLPPGQAAKGGLGEGGPVGIRSLDGALDHDAPTTRAW